MSFLLIFRPIFHGIFWGIKNPNHLEDPKEKLASPTGLVGHGREKLTKLRFKVPRPNLVTTNRFGVVGMAHARRSPFFFHPCSNAWNTEWIFGMIEIWWSRSNPLLNLVESLEKRFKSIQNGFCLQLPKQAESISAFMLWCFLSAVFFLDVAGLTSLTIYALRVNDTTL